jgi:hypothetical protein
MSGNEIDVYLPLILHNHPIFPSVTVYPPVGTTDIWFLFTGSDFVPYETVSQWFKEPDGTRWDLNDTVADEEGHFFYGVKLTGGWPAGTYTYYARGAISQHTASTTFVLATSDLPRGTWKAFSER